LKVQFNKSIFFSPAQVKAPKPEKNVGHCRECKMMRGTGMMLDFFLDGSFSHVYLTLCYQDYPETDTSELIRACHQLVLASIAKLLLWQSFLHKNH
jgi:hypothetical protein